MWSIGSEQPDLALDLFELRSKGVVTKLRSMTVRDIVVVQGLTKSIWMMLRWNARMVLWSDERS